MTINGSSRYATTNAFRRALEDRLKREAKIRGRSLEELRREFLFQRFLALVFSGPDGGWVLKGGASLLLRLAGARFSKDLDLLHVGGSSADEAIAELRALASPRAGDHLTFVLEDGVSYSGTHPVVKISVAAYIGARYGGFPVDLALDLHFLGAPERIKPAPVVDMPGLTEPPEVLVYPLADQVADKVCAMYELYGEAQSPSTRYRDLVDLALIVSSCELEADAVLRSLRSESRRRQMHLPMQLVSPGPQWSGGYRAYARRAKIAQDLHSMETALRHVGECLNPLLEDSCDQGRWVPGTGWSGHEHGSS